MGEGVGGEGTPRRLLDRSRQVEVVQALVAVQARRRRQAEVGALAGELGGGVLRFGGGGAGGAAGGIVAPVFVPVDGKFGAEDAGRDEGADVEADAVVQIGL